MTDGELGGEVKILHDWVLALAARMDQFAESRTSSRRFTLTTVIAAASVVLLALGLIGGLIAAVV